VSPGHPLAKVLIVDADPAKLGALRSALAAAAYKVTSATSASFALTTLERDRPDLIVSGARTEDMDGVEFCSIIRSDPATHDIPFLLLSGPTRPTPWAVAQAGVDMLLAGDFVVSAVLDRISKLLRHVVPGEPGSAGPEPAPAPLPTARPASASPSSASGNQATGMPRAEVGGRTFQGSFGALDLTEVTQAIGLGGKTGRLALALSVGDGSLLFESGRVIHAEFAGLTGESAFAALVAAAQHDPEGTFRFKPATGADAGPRTIQKSLDQLLISVASEIDEGRAATGAPPPPPRT
jgi:CheY-like chemotaxis protein